MERASHIERRLNLNERFTVTNLISRSINKFPIYTSLVWLRNRFMVVNDAILDAFESALIKKKNHLNVVNMHCKSANLKSSMMC